MSTLDRQFTRLRERALRAPLVRARRLVEPTIALPGGVLLGLSVNK